MAARTILFLFVYLLGTIPGMGQKLKKISQENLLVEYDGMMEHLQTLHPALYRFTSVQELDLLISSTRSQINRSMNALEFYRIVAPVYASIRDGHTKLLINPKLFDKVFEHRGIFPYKVWIDDDNRLFVVDSELDRTNLAKKTEILKINGLTVNDFLKKAGYYVNYEQEETRKRAIEDNFDWMLSLTTDYDSFVDLVTMGKDHGEIRIALIPYKKWKRQTRKNEKKELKRVLALENNEYTELSEDVGYLRIYQFGSYNIGKYISNIRNIFRFIEEQEMKSLVIDLRGNSGGDPKYVEAIIHYLSDIPFCRIEMMYQMMKGAPTTIHHFLSDSEGTPASFNSHHMIFFGNDDAHREPLDFEFEFEGDIYLLVDETSYSAAATLASVIKCYNLGVIIGRMTGGTRIFQAYSNAQSFPRTDFKSFVSTTMIYTSCSGFEDETGSREGVVPHIVLDPTLDDIVDKRDLELDFLMNHIENGTLESLQEYIRN